jgi:hypothetical protein
VDEELTYLNTATPEAFRSNEIADFGHRPLTVLCAWTIALAHKRREFFAAKRGEPRFAQIATTLLYHLALDEVSRKKATPFKKHQLKTYKAGFASVEEQYNFYRSQDINLIAELADFIVEKHYKPYNNCFEGESDHKLLAFPTAEGLRKLREEFPDLEEGASSLKQA